MKEIKRKGRFKRVVKRIVKGMLIVIGVITAVTIVLSVGTYVVTVNQGFNKILKIR